MSGTGGVWSRQAAQWERVGAPLRPSAQDVAWHRRIAFELASAGTRVASVTTAGGPDEKTVPDPVSRLRVLQLGVTPEIARVEWPRGTRLVAVDLCADMIARVWPSPPDAEVVQADWLAMPLADGTRDMVVSDGCFGVLQHPGAHRALLAAIGNILRDDGRFVFRIFTRPPQAELPAAVYEDALAGRIASFHAFKLRLLMAMQASSEAGVCTGDVWDELHRNGPSFEELSRAAAWPLELIETIHAYRGQQTRYSFPRLAELRALIADTALEEIACHVPDYELGARCPTIVLQRLQR